MTNNVTWKLPFFRLTHLLTAVFIVLKLAGVVDWSGWVCLAPALAWWALNLTIMMVVLLVILIVTIIKSH